MVGIYISIFRGLKVMELVVGWVGVLFPVRLYCEVPGSFEDIDLDLDLGA